MGKPYFVDIPSPHQMVNCTIHTTCLLPIYIVSSVKVNDIQVTESFIDKYQISKIKNVTHKGQPVYQAELQFKSFVLGNKKICLIAKDIIGAESEKVCITSHIDPTDACMSAPCKNYATCVTDSRTGNFKCICRPGSTGKICEIWTDPCVPDPCVRNTTYACLHGVCYCKPGFTGRTCEISELNK
ncbi:protein jagged-2-like [Ruditapes philippinarum]|uniref:protein jagged-2-like n=1 Tax=Ruditapes philippinarum TaxID=129788 RepID=UPI00295A8B80|nr:protein jagged-2-like [Ruditapes philippinarum]